MVDTDELASNAKPRTPPGIHQHFRLWEEAYHGEIYSFLVKQLWSRPVNLLGSLTSF